jgi:hypothetical protein
MDVEGLPHVSHRNTLRAAAGALTFQAWSDPEPQASRLSSWQNAEHGQEQRPLCERQPQINEKNKSVLI